MVGLGCGARSYTRALHYGSEYAVGEPGRPRDPRRLPGAARRRVRPGRARLPARRRTTSGAGTSSSRSCRAKGCPSTAYARRFGSEVLDDLPELADLEGLGLAVRRPRIDSR